MITLTGTGARYQVLRREVHNDITGTGTLAVKPDIDSWKLKYFGRLSSLVGKTQFPPIFNATVWNDLLSRFTIVMNADEQTLFLFFG